MATPGTAGHERRADVGRELVRAMPMLRAWLRHLGADHEQADEALQETAAWCCEHAGDYAPGTSFGAWSRAVARFRLLAIWRDRGRADARIDREWAEAIPAAEWDALAEASTDEAAALARCVDALPDPSRRLIDLIYRERCTAADAAARLRSSAAAISMALSRLRRRLRDCVERRIGASS